MLVSLSVNLLLLGSSGAMSATTSANVLNIRVASMAVEVNSSLEHIYYICVWLDTGVPYGDSLLGAHSLFVAPIIAFSRWENGTDFVVSSPI